MKPPIIYLIRNKDKYWLPHYIPGSKDECIKEYLDALDGLVEQIRTYRETSIGIPKFLVLKDHVVYNITFEYLYFFSDQLEEKLKKENLSVKISSYSFSTNFDAYSLIQKQILYYEYSDFLNKTIHPIEYMGSNDKRETFVIYELTDILPKYNSNFLIGNESCFWAEYKDLLTRSNGQKINKQNKSPEYPKNRKGDKYNLIRLTGEIVVGEMELDHKRFLSLWKIESGEKLSVHEILAWKKIV